MSAPSQLTLHVLGPSHPCKTVEAALALQGLEYERVELAPGPHGDEIETISDQASARSPAP